MNKVYFKQNQPGCWWLTELTDILYFKVVNFITKEEREYIFSWTRNNDLSEYPNNPVRKYDVEIDEEKIYFLVYQDVDGWLVKPESPGQIDNIARLKDLNFVGHAFEVVE